MTTAGRLDRDTSALLVVDVQARLAPHIAGHEALVARVGALLDAAERFGIPRHLTEHCPGDLGPVIPSLRTRFAADAIHVKSRFGATHHPEFVAKLRSTGRDTVVLAGMEAHVCVLQTGLGLLAHGFSLFVVVDAVGARGIRADDRALALERLRGAGAVLTTTETTLFEWTHDGRDPEFRAILATVKRLP